MGQGFFDVIREYIPSIELILKYIGFIGILFVCYFIVSVIARYISFSITRKFPPEHQYIGKPLHQVFKVILFIVAVIALLWWRGIDVSHLVISAGLIGSVALYILKDPIENTMSAFLLIVQYKLKHDQEITIIASGGPYSGRLIALDLGHVFLKSKRKVYIIPNGTVSQSIIEINSRDASDLTASFLKRLKKEEKLLKNIEKEGKTIIKDIEKI